jgi:hypothetical protein
MANSKEGKQSSLKESTGGSAEDVEEGKGAREREARVREERRIRRAARRSGYVIAIVVNVILLFFFNNLFFIFDNLLKLHIPFLTSDFNACLWAINLSLTATIVANSLFLAYDARWIRHLVQVILSIIALVAIYVIYTIFPFIFPEELWMLALKIALIASMVGIIIATIVEFVRLILNRD